MTIFLLKLTLAWGLFALLYTLLLRRETFFRANRAYLLGTAALGILLASPPDWLTAWQDEAPAAFVGLPAVKVGLQRAEEAVRTWNWLDYLWIGYWVGAGVALLRMSWGLFKIVRMAAQGEQKYLPDGCVLIKTTAANVPFSFFKWVFVPKEAAFSESYSSNAMLAHERAHAHDWHSADVLFVELLCVVFWFHPLAHWYRRATRAVHEYLADAEASRLTDRKQYGLLLIRQAQTGMSLAFVNHFFQSPLKQRLIMLTQNASPALRAWKYGLLLPVLTLIFLLTSQAPTVAQRDGGKGQEKELKKTSSIEQIPQFPGGHAALMKFLSDNIKYPEAAKYDLAQGTVNVQFTINENGAVTDVAGIKTDQNGWRQDFQDEAVRVIKSMPNWQPALSKGKPAKVTLTLPIKFGL